MNVIDYLILAALAYAAYTGYKKGLAAGLARLAGYFFGLAAAYIFSTPLARWLDKSFELVKKLTPWFTEQLALPAATRSAGIASIPFEKAEKIISDYNLPDTFKTIMLNYVDEVAQMPATLGIKTMGEAVAYLVGNFVLTALIFFFIYGVTAWVIGKVVPGHMKKAAPGPVNLIDNLAGAALRLAGTAISIAVTLSVLMPVFSIGLIKSRGSVMSAFAVLFQNSKLANMFMQGMMQLIS